MRVIHKKISLEPMTSRLPSIVPAYMDNVLYTFDSTSLKERDYTYTSNYGMIPCNIPIPNNINVPCLNELSCRVISFERLSNWYYKFTEYYHLLNDYSHCGTVYKSAHAYYKNEVKLWPEDLYYGTSEQTYIDLDEEIKCMGGIPKTSPIDVTIDCDGNTVSKKYKTFDDDGEESGTEGFYHYICNNIVPTYTISREYQDYWQRDTLYYPDVIKWIGWFDERSEYSGYSTETSCKNSSNCCECVDYVKRGGKAERDKMLTWYNTIQTNITDLNDIIVTIEQPTNCDEPIKKAKKCYTPRTIAPIELQNSIEDLGEFSIFCEEYKEGVDYRGAEQGDTANTKGGTIVMKDNKVLKLKDGKTGYKFNPTYMVNEYDSSAWTTMGYFIKRASITGLTTSKVNSLFVDNYLVDDMGNPIEGLYNVGDKYNHQPPEGSTLQPIYQVGHKYNMVRNEDVENQFIGDEIDTMSFYYKRLDGTKDTAVSAENDKALEAITSATKSDTTKAYYDDIFCDITYHIGNIYNLDDDNQLSKIYDGVEYIETVQFVKTRTEYYLKRMTKDYAPDEKSVPSAHTVSYPIYVYKIKQEKEEIRENTYDTTYDDSLSKIGYSVTRRYDETDSKLPIIREEYKLGIAAPQSVKGDIYIDRGINAAFEKHLKLGECATFESLLQFGNGYFKIIEN